MGVKAQNASTDSRTMKESVTRLSTEPLANGR
jgi:hypothetical protein